MAEEKDLKKLKDYTDVVNAKLPEIEGMVKNNVGSTLRQLTLE